MSRTVPAVLLAVTAASARLSGPVPTELAWQGGPEETLHFDSSVAGGFAVTGEYEYHAAVRFTPEKPCSVKAVSFYQFDESAENGRVYIYGANTNSRPGARLAQATYPAAGTMRWKRVDLAQPVPVDSGVDFWTCVTTTYYTGDHPLGVDRGPLVRHRGGFIKVPLMGETWYQLSDGPFYTNRNWNQRAIVVSVTGVEEELGPSAPVEPRCATVVRGVFWLGAGHNPIPSGESGLCPKPVLLDATGRKVMTLTPGPNDVSRLAPGVYFVRSTFDTRHSTMGTKVVVTR